ncbi:hypothetical protein GGI15_001621 [Coemansia interrupta]|uniref:Transmembrane protein n=1 Tax=Coemansia interrupta TaxID=1126814 RepID=A0A9W8LNP7_9FUNG|nr:hypothetical protein GGI15_001621 [Coemansia interrupta]
MLPRMRSNSQSQSAGNTPVRRQGTVGRGGPSTLGRSAATRPGVQLSTPPQGANTLRRGRRQSETGVGAWRHEQSPMPALAASHSLAGRGAGSIAADDAWHTPTLAERRRPESRASVLSAGSTQMGQQSSGKQPVLVRSVRVDLKVVPPELDAARAERRGGVQHVTPGQQQQQAAGARVRGRMDVSVHVLHRGEQTVDLLAVAESLAVQRSRSHRHWRDDADAWPLVERTACVVAGDHGAGDYAESVASPVLSPVLPDSQASPVLMRRGDHNQPNQQSQPHQQRSRPSSLFHVDQLSPYPPAPSPPSPPQAHLGEPPDAAGVARYETHTQASYSRARAGVSDRVALYNRLIQEQARADGPQPQPQASRRTMSFGAERLGSLAADTRPASVMGGDAGGRAGRLRSGLLQRAATSPERPHSSMALMSPTALRDPDPGAAPAADPDLRGLGLTVARRRSSSIASSDAPRDETAAPADLCCFETDRTRGVLVARLGGQRRYRLTVWFSLPASSDTRPSSGAVAWESGSASLRGIPRAISARVRVRLPHRLPPLGCGAGEPHVAGCYFQARMLQPSRVQQQGARIVDARSASLAARSGRATLAVFSPLSPAGAPLQAPHDGHGEPGGWLLTDDSDAEPGQPCVPPPPLPADGESVLDRKLRRFISEYGRRGSFSLDAARPPLVGDSEADRRAAWARFEGEHPDYDFSQTELFSFKLSLADSFSLAWSPHAEPAVYAAMPPGRQQQQQHQSRLVELSPLLSQETMPFEQYQLGDHPPAFGFLETIDSVEPSPAVGAPPESLAFEPPTPPAAMPSIEAVDVRVTVRPDGLTLWTTVALRHAGNATVALDFASVRCAIGASRDLPLRHCSAAVDGCEAAFTVGPSAPSSRLCVQLPDAAAETVELTVQSELSLALPLDGMVLTQSFYVAVPTSLVSLVSATGAGETCSVRAAIRTVNEADAWVRVDAKTMAVDALSLMPQAVQTSDEMCEVITIERRGSPLTASYVQRLVEAYAATRSLTVQPTLASSVSVSVDLECAPAADRLDVRVSVACSLSSFASWRSQLEARFGASVPASSAWLAVVVPDAEDGRCAWALDELQRAADANAVAGLRAAAIPVQSVVDIGRRLVAVPLSQPLSSARGGLAAEVATDSLVCVFTATMPLSGLANEPCLHLPAPRLDMSSLLLPPGSTGMRYAQACDSLLAAASVTVSLASGGTPLRMTRSEGRTIHCVLDTSPGQPMVSKKLQVDLADLAGLRLRLSQMPRPPVIEYATKATDTDDLNPKAESIVADVADDVVVHGESEDNDATAAVSCASSDVMLPISPEPPVSATPPPAAAAAVDSLLGDAMSVYSVVSNSSLTSGASNAAGSLRNRHGARARSAMPSESEPLLGNHTDGPEQQSVVSRVWGWAMWGLGLVLLMAAIGGLLFAVSEFSSSVTATAQSQIHYEPSPSVQAVPLHTQVDSQSMLRTRLFRVKSTDNYAMARDERRDNEEEAPFVVSNDGSHSFNTVAGDTSSLLGWVFHVFIEPILEAIGANAY